ncbi:hypothetical protein CAC42_4733 [Sphaceloma murrayae]|uniref:Uncharacterized protein n=1 Tax=Sphaceloma murrayae TaxID=2082308 RepID=A0A2K1QP96_9PEZI|nr:hypothetical protein CAC42_4733 [Sphaceloma murrayae]
MQSTQSSFKQDLPVLARPEESFEDRRRRVQAARILESSEQLIWHSIARHESVPQTRRYFRTIAAGMDPSKLPGQKSACDSGKSRNVEAKIIEKAPSLPARSHVGPSKSKRKQAES